MTIREAKAVLMRNGYRIVEGKEKSKEEIIALFDVQAGKIDTALEKLVDITEKNHVEDLFLPLLQELNLKLEDFNSAMSKWEYE